MRTLSRIDVHTHFLPSALLRALEKRTDVPMVVNHNGGRLVAYGRNAAYPLKPEMTSLDLKLSHMDDAGITLSVLSVNVPGVDWLAPEEGAAVARDANDELIAAVKAYPERFAAMATLPLQAPDRASSELERAIRAGLKGTMLYSNVSGRSLDEPQFRVVFETIAALDVPMLLHPTYPLCATSVDAYALIPVIGFLFDTTTAALRLILGGLYDRHPGFKLILAHVGSVIPYIVGRIDYESSRIPGGLGALQSSPQEHIRKLYVDSVSVWAPALRLALDFFGPDRILLGTDHPFWEPRRTLDMVAELELSTVVAEKVNSGNARRVFGL